MVSPQEAGAFNNGQVGTLSSSAGPRPSPLMAMTLQGVPVHPSACQYTTELPKAAPSPGCPLHSHPSQCTPVNPKEHHAQSISSPLSLQCFPFLFVHDSGVPKSPSLTPTPKPINFGPLSPLSPAPTHPPLQPPCPPHWNSCLPTRIPQPRSLGPPVPPSSLSLGSPSPTPFPLSLEAPNSPCSPCLHPHRGPCRNRDQVRLARVGLGGAEGIFPLTPGAWGHL